jgi:hypothetical protein
MQAQLFFAQPAATAFSSRRPSMEITVVSNEAASGNPFAASFRVSLIRTGEQRAQCVALTGSYTHS